MEIISASESPLGRLVEAYGEKVEGLSIYPSVLEFLEDAAKDIDAYDWWLIVGGETENIKIESSCNYFYP